MTADNPGVRPKALYPISGDPVTIGHINIIERAARQFSPLLVGIGVNPSKENSYLFSLDERAEMARRSIQHIPNVEVVAYKGLTVYYAAKKGIPVIVRGLRNPADATDSQSMSWVNKSIRKGIEVVDLHCEQDLAHISSSFAKNILENNGPVHKYVTLYVKQCLEAKMLGQYIVGVTGGIGVGKSTVTETFVELGKEQGILVHNIDLDKICHQIQGESNNPEFSDPAYLDARKRIIEAFGPEVGLPDGKINRKTLGQIVFGNPEALQTLNQIMNDALELRIPDELRGKRGLILINAALIVESEMTYLCNNNVLLVNADKVSQRRRLEDKGFTEEQIRKRVESQLSFEKKLEGIEAAIKRDYQGRVWVLDNPDGDNRGAIKSAFDSIVKELRVK